MALKSRKHIVDKMCRHRQLRLLQQTLSALIRDILSPAKVLQKAFASLDGGSTAAQITFSACMHHAQYAKNTHMLSMPRIHTKNTHQEYTLHTECTGTILCNLLIVL